MEPHSISRNSFMKYMYSSLGVDGTHLLKLARFCITLAMSVSVRDVRSAGYSCIRLNREGDMMAGHMKRRNREELMRLSARSSLPRSAHLALHEAKTSFSSRGNMLKQEDGFISPLSRRRLSKPTYSTVPSTSGYGCMVI
ncbi:hypothetical protein F7725_025149 [Dissostichus mawsoni]|uniref:Uncharacterized protein n=1 Tax=Dissostichus mawsoni TaxID=36200 RepID=A0A7J5XAB5_DISMA|nr:hypothetical protein F7725_025149 [Dissostichus mawsoni]